MNSSEYSIDEHIRAAIMHYLLPQKRIEMLLRFNTLVNLTRSHGKGTEDARASQEETRE